MGVVNTVWRRSARMPVLCSCASACWMRSCRSDFFWRLVAFTIWRRRIASGRDTSPAARSRRVRSSTGHVEQARAVVGERFEQRDGGADLVVKFGSVGHSLES